MKIKVGISFLSVSILILIPLLESNFNARVTIKRYGELSWDDFQGIPQVFSTYGAVISSNVYLEYDSSTSSYRAFAGQNNVRSWVKNSTLESDYALNHEQYHFKITELHARMLNKFIRENPGLSGYRYQLELDKIRHDLNGMQDKYDKQTDHSLIYDKQRRWEYRIDSLLRLDSGWVTDQFSGATAFFPQEPEINRGNFNKETWYRNYTLKKYGMYLSVISYQISPINTDSLVENLRGIYNKDPRKIRSLSLDTTLYPIEVFIISSDTASRTYYNRWIYNHAFLYQVGASFPHDTGDTTGYFHIAKSFLHSFRIEDTDRYWFDKLEQSTSPIIHTFVRSTKITKGGHLTNCMRMKDSVQRGFYRGPFFRDDGALFLAFDNIDHPDSLLSESVLIIGKDSYSYKPELSGQLFFVPTDNLPRERYWINFGYLLKQDSLDECKEFYFQSLEVNPIALQRDITSIQN